MQDMGTVLIVDSEDRTRGTVFESAVKYGEVPERCSTYGEARGLLAKRRFDVVFCSDTLPDGKYADVIHAAKPTPVIVLSHLGEWDPYLAALKAGAFDCIGYPPYPAEVDIILSFALNECRNFAPDDLQGPRAK